MALTLLSTRLDNLATTLKTSLATVFADDPSKATAILQAYNIDESRPEDKTPILHFINDIGFASAARATAKAWASAGEKSYLSHFNMPNPWPGAAQGQATHALDAAILLQNYNEFLNGGQKAMAERMGRDMVEFAYGREPFKPFGQGEAAMVYYASSEGKTDESASVAGSEASKTGRRTVLDEVSAGDPGVLDRMLDAFVLFVSGPK